MAIEENNLKNLIESGEYKECIESIIDSLVAGKKSLIDEFVEYFNTIDPDRKENFIKSTVELMKEKENIREIAIPFIELTKIFINTGQDDFVERFVKAVPFNSLKAKAYTTIANMLEENDERKRSAGYLEKALHTADSIGVAIEKSEVYSAISILMSIQGRFDSALDILSQIEIDSERAYSVKRILREIISGKVSTEKETKEQKVRLLNQLALLTSQIKDENLKSECFVYITREMIKSEMVYEALNLARKIKDEKAKISTLGVIIDVMAKSGNKWEAKAVVDEVKEAANNIEETDKNKSSALSEVIQAQIKVDMVDEALAISNDVSDTGWKAMNITLIAEGMVNNGMYDRAVELLAKSVELTENIDHAGSKSTVLSSVFEVLTAIDEKYDQEKLKPVFRMIMKVLRQITDDSFLYSIINYMYELDFLEKYEIMKNAIIKHIKTLKDEKVKKHILNIITK